jgi:hypothetical protein
MAHIMPEPFANGKLVHLRDDSQLLLTLDTWHMARLCLLLGYHAITRDQSDNHSAISVVDCRMIRKAVINVLLSNRVSLDCR